MKVWIDQDLCTGDGLCAQYAPEVFELDIDGLAYVKSPDDELLQEAESEEGATLDDFGELCDYLATVHPSRYGRLIEGVSAVYLRGVHAAPDQDVALRLVALADRLYDRAIPVRVSGEALSRLFTDEMLHGGYRKKYLRAISRLTALSRDLARS